MSRVRITVIVAAIAQMIGAFGWLLAMVSHHGVGHPAIPVLVGHLLVGAMGLVSQARGIFRRTLVVLNWVLVALWTWALLGAVAKALRETSKPSLLPLMIILVLLTLVPCAISAVILGDLPRRDR